MAISDIDPLTPDPNDLAGLGDDQIRQLKDDVKTTFEGMDALVTQPDGLGGTEPMTSATLSALPDRVSATERGTPIGLIAIWFDVVPPEGWALCDGSVANGITTPNMGGRFVLDAGIFAVGFTGGTSSPTATTSSGSHAHAGTTVAVNNHTLTEAQIPAHDLLVDLPVDIAYANGGSLYGGSHQEAPGSDNSSTFVYKPLTETAGGGTGHNHTASISVAAHPGHTHDYTPVPAYITMKFIMYVGIP